MAIHPETAQKLRAEVMHHCGPDGAPTYENIKELKYSKYRINQVSHIVRPSLVRAVINETLRLFPPVPLNVRECRAGACALPLSDPTYPPSKSTQRLYMPGGTTIMYLPLLTQRNHALWGDDADLFDPDRWIQPDRLAKITSNPMMFTPFSAGPRIVRSTPQLLLSTSIILLRSALAKTTRITKRHTSSCDFYNNSIRSHWPLSSSPKAHYLHQRGAIARVVSALSGYGLRLQ